MPSFLRGAGTITGDDALGGCGSAGIGAECERDAYLIQPTGLIPAKRVADFTLSPRP